MQGYTNFFLFLFQSIDCGYSVEPPRRVNPQSMFMSKNKKKKYLNFSTENAHFLQLLKNLRLLHGHVFMFSLRILDKSDDNRETWHL